MDYSLILNGKSKHLGTPINFNEDNGGIGLMAENGNSYATIGGYKNSFNKPSYYAGYGYDKKFGDDYYAKIGLLGGLVSGYDDKLTPMILPKFSIGSEDMGALNLMYAPKYKKSPPVLMVNYSIPIK